MKDPKKLQESGDLDAVILVFGSDYDAVRPFSGDLIVRIGPAPSFFKLCLCLAGR
jgi:hypothetical protein